MKHFKLITDEHKVYPSTIFDSVKENTFFNYTHVVQTINHKFIKHEGIEKLCYQSRFTDKDLKNYIKYNIDCFIYNGHSHNDFRKDMSTWHAEVLIYEIVYKNLYNYSSIEYNKLLEIPANQRKIQYYAKRIRPLLKAVSAEALLMNIHIP